MWFSAFRVRSGYPSSVSKSSAKPGSSCVVSGIQKEQAKGAKLEQLEKALAPFGKGDVRKRLELFVSRMGKEPYEARVPDGIHGQLRGKLEGFRNRASSEYMESVHARAGNRKPILQIYLLEPPPEADVGGMPLVTLAFYWPAHEPSNFCAVTTGLEPRPSAPTPHKFYDAVEAVLREWNFPMTTKRLRNTVMEWLGPGCKKDFFDKHIAKIPEGRQYEPVPKRKAYMPAGWGSEAGVEARLDAELTKRAIELIQNDSAEHKSDDVFSKILEDEKFGDFFSAAYPKDKTRFNGLMTGGVLAENGIVKTSGRPITWQYQG